MGKYFIDYDICIDFNNINNNKYDFYDFEHFMKKQRNSILFCAVKHRRS